MHANLFALAHRHQWALFPIRPGWKSPAGLVPSWKDASSTDPADWQRWSTMHPGCNFGVDLSKSQSVVFDIDVKLVGRDEALRQVAAWAMSFGLDLQRGYLCVGSPTGGVHVYFPNPGNVLRTRVPRELTGVLDVKASGGYVVAPYCRTAVAAGDAHVKADGEYQVFGVQAPTPLPPAMVEFLSPRVDPRGDSATVAPEGTIERINQQAFAAKEIAAELERLRRTSENRNIALNIAAGACFRYVGAGLFDETALESALFEAARETGLPDKEIAKTLASGRGHGLATSDEAWLPPPRRSVPQIFGPSTATARLAASDLAEGMARSGCVALWSARQGTGKTALLSMLGALQTVDQVFVAVSDRAGGVASGAIPTPGSGWYTDRFALFMISFEDAPGFVAGMNGWLKGRGLTQAFPQRVHVFDPDPADGRLIAAGQTGHGFLNTALSDKILGELDRFAKANPGLPVLVALDSLSAAVANNSDQASAVAMTAWARALARNGFAVVLIAHPPKNGESVARGMGDYENEPDIICAIEVLEYGEERTTGANIRKFRPASGRVGDRIDFKSRLGDPAPRDIFNSALGNLAVDRMMLYSKPAIIENIEYKIKPDPVDPKAKTPAKKSQGPTAVPEKTVASFGPPVGAK